MSFKEIFIKICLKDLHVNILQLEIKLVYILIYQAVSSSTKFLLYAPCLGDFP